MDGFFYWSGVVAWGALGVAGVLVSADVAMDWVVQSLWTKRMFLEFVWHRLKQKKGWRDPEIATLKADFEHFGGATREQNRSAD